MSAATVAIACGGPKRFLGRPVPAICEHGVGPGASYQCLGWVLDQVFVAKSRIYDDPKLQAYVAGIGQRLTVHANRPDLSWTFRILDEPDVQAYALIGGYVYVSRGALARLGTEAELAAILGHEIAHIAAGHSLESVMGLADDNTRYDQMLSRFFERERDEERQADELAVMYLRAAGYAPQAMLSMLSRIHQGQRPNIQLSSIRSKEDESQSVLQRWDASHPSRRVRMARVALLIDADVTGVASERANHRLARDAYTRELAGLVLGNDPRHGYLRQQQYVMPRAGVTFDVPIDWSLERDTHGFHGTHAREAVRMFALPLGLVHYYFFREALDGDSTRTTAGRRIHTGWLLEDAASSLAISDRNDDERYTHVALMNVDSSYFMVMVIGADKPTVARSFSDAIAGLREITVQERTQIVPARITIEPSVQTGTVRERVKAQCEEKHDEILWIQGRASDEMVDMGSLIRCATPARPTVTP